MRLEEMDWGNITPELYNEKNNTAILLFNHFLEEKELVLMNITFARSRFKWYSRHLPEGCRQILIFDTRGQNIKKEIYDLVEQEMGKHCIRVEFKKDGD